MFRIFFFLLPVHNLISYIFLAYLNLPQCLPIVLLWCFNLCWNVLKSMLVLVYIIVPGLHNVFLGFLVFCGLHLWLFSGLLILNLIVWLLLICFLLLPFELFHWLLWFLLCGREVILHRCIYVVDPPGILLYTVYVCYTIYTVYSITYSDELTHQYNILYIENIFK